MTEPAGLTVNRRPRRRLVGWVAVAIVALLLLAGAYVWEREHGAYHLAIASCYSDNMFMLREGLEE